MSSRVLLYGRSEIRILPTVGAAPLRRRVNEVARKRRELDDGVAEGEAEEDDEQ